MNFEYRATNKVKNSEQYEMILKSRYTKIFVTYSHWTLEKYINVPVKVIEIVSKTLITEEIYTRR